MDSPPLELRCSNFMEDRRRTTLSDQLMVLQSAALVDLLRSRQDNDDGEVSSPANGLAPFGNGGEGERQSLTLGDVLTFEKREADASAAAAAGLVTESADVDAAIADEAEITESSDPSMAVDRSRTLFDIIWAEKAAAGTGSSAAAVRSSWRALRNVLWCRPATHSAADLEGFEIGFADAHLRVAVDANADANAAAGDGGEVETAETARVSLMALLEEADRYGGSGGGAESSTAAVEESEDMIVGGTCCVCMVRHKGAAFIPCGHTFCRGCARDVWGTRAACPLCNRLILDLLDIF